jgi:PHD/YefM family antitoxin component YafN of YafNO toxin-antitoxin module
VLRAVKPVELRKNQREMLDLVYNGEILFVARPARKNVVILSEDEFNKREKALKDAESLVEEYKSIIESKGQTK